MIEAYAKPVINKYLLVPITAFLIKYISDKPNTYTALSCILGILGFPLVYLGFLYTGLMLFLLSGFFDMLDGSIARRVDSSSSYGAVLDIMSDRIVEFTIIMAIYFQSPTINALYCLGMLGSIFLCVTSFLVVGIFSANDSHKSFYYSPGLIERPEAFLFFFAMLLFGQYIHILSIVFIVLVIYTTILRIYQFRYQIRS